MSKPKKQPKNEGTKVLGAVALQYVQPHVHEAYADAVSDAVHFAILQVYYVQFLVTDDNENEG